MADGDAEYQKYLDDLEYEKYLANFQQDSNVIGTPTAAQNEIGPDLQLGPLDNFAKGFPEIPRNFAHFAEDTYNFIQPIDSLSTLPAGQRSGPRGAIERAGALNTAKTVSNLGFGTAGALGGAELGTMAGTGLGVLAAPFTGGLSIPAGAFLGGLAGGGLGFAGGSTLSDLANTSAQSNATDFGNWLYNRNDPLPEMPSVQDLLAKFGYDASQGVGLGLAGEAVGATAKGGFNGLQKFTGPLTKNSRDVAAGKMLTNLTQDPNLAATIDAASQAKSGDPLLGNKSLAELIGNAPLKNQEKVLSGTIGQGPTITKNLDRTRSQVEFLNNLEPAQFGAEGVQNIIESKLNTFDKSAAAQQDALASGVQSSIDTLPAPIQDAQAGELMQNRIRDNSQIAQIAVGNKFKALPKDVVPINSGKIAEQKVAEIYDKGTGGPPPLITQLVDEIHGQSQKSPLIDPRTNQPFPPRAIPQTLQEIQNLRSRALEIADQAKSSNPPDYRAQRVANDIAKALDDAVDVAGKTGLMDPGTYQAWLEARKANFEKRTDFDRGTTKPVIDNGTFSKNPLSPSLVPEQYFKRGSGGKERIENYKKVAGTDAGALEPLYRYIATRFASYAEGEGGLLNAKKARDFIIAHKDSLNQLPELRRQLEDARSAQTLLDEFKGSTGKTKADIQYDALKELTEVNPDKVVQTVFSGRKSIQQIRSLKNFVKGDPDALAGFRRAIIDYIQKVAVDHERVIGLDGTVTIGPNARFSGAKFNQFLKTHEAALKEALSEDQFNGFQQLYGDIDSGLSVANSKAIPGSQTTPIDNALQTIKRMSLDSIVKIPAFGPVAQFVMDVVGKVPREKLLGRVHEALLDPKLAKELVQKSNPGRTIKTFMDVFKQDLPPSSFPSKTVAATGIPSRDRKELHTVEKATGKESFPTPEKIKAPPPKPIDISPWKMNERQAKADIPSLISESSKKYGVPEELIKRVVGVESNGNITARSSRGAGGLMQLMPGTAGDMGVTNVDDPAQNIDGGTKYLAFLLKKYHGDLTKTLAGYNAGFGKVDQYGGVPPYRETRNYVQSILGSPS